MHFAYLALFHYEFCPNVSSFPILLLLIGPFSALFLNYFQILDVSTKATSATIYVLEDSFIKSIKAEENIVLLLNYRRKTSSKIVSK